MARKKAREIAFLLLFEDSFGTSTARETFPQLFDETDPKSTLNEIDLAYVEELRGLAREHREEIDAAIGAHAKGWALSRLARVDLALMRLAVCEILYMEDIPRAVSINEAVELAKVYSSDEGPAYINGVLGAFVRGL